MFRTLTAVAFATLIITPALADSSFEARVHDAAVKACAVESAPGMRPLSHYGNITDTCVRRLSKEALAKSRMNAQLAAADRVAGN